MIIDGKAISNEIQQELKCEISTFTTRKPGLAVILVGDDPASKIYVRNKTRRCEEIGIRSVDRRLPDTVSEEELLSEVLAFNEDPSIDGILVQLPLPKQISSSRILNAILPEKDVDGFHPINVGKMLVGDDDGFLPCTPHGVQTLLKRTNIDPMGKHVVIVGRSNIVGKPLAAILMQKASFCNATVTVAHSYTPT